MGKIIIDCDATPFIPEGWEIRPEDQLPGAVGGMLEIDPAKVLLYLDKCQKGGWSLVGYHLVGKLIGKPLLKANVLDHLLADTDLIPEAWKIDEQGRTQYIHFWGTVYRGTVHHGLRDNPCVRYLFWNNSEWCWNYSWLYYEFGGVFVQPAAILVG